jgi:hypothetical protein
MHEGSWLFTPIRAVDLKQNDVQDDHHGDGAEGAGNEGNHGSKPR